MKLFYLAICFAILLVCISDIEATKKRKKKRHVLPVIHITRDNLYKENPRKRENIDGQVMLSMGISSQNISKSNDIGYIGTVSVGIPPQNFSVEFSTSSTDAWIPSALCLTCEKLATFNQNLSSTFNDKDSKLISFGYADGTVIMGYTFIDCVTVGGITVKNQPLIQARIIRSNQILNGVFGLAFQGLSKKFNAPFFTSMFQQNLIPKNAFSFWANKNESNNAVLILGGSNPDYYNGNLTYANLVPDSRLWNIELDGIALKDTSICEIELDNVCDAILDTSYSFIAGPSLQIQKIISSINGTYNEALNLFTVDCDQADSLPSIDFIINQKKFSVFPKDYVDKRTLGICFVTLEMLDALKPSTWFLGDAFLANFYAEYDADNLRVGFAEPKSLSQVPLLP